MGEQELGMLFRNETANFRASEPFFSWGNVGGQCLHAKTAEAMPLSLLMN